MYLAKFCKKLVSWVCHNTLTGEVHSAWRNREDAVIMANDLNKHLKRLANRGAWR